MTESMFESMAERLKTDISKEIAYTYVVFVPNNAESVISEMKSNILLKDSKLLGQNLLDSVWNKQKFPSDVLNSNLEKHITDFYDELRLSTKTSRELASYGERGKEFEKRFNESLNQSKKSLISLVKYEMNLQMMQGNDTKSVVEHIQNILTRRLSYLRGFLEDTAGQLGQYMVLWDYQDKGYTHYRLKTNGDNCKECNALDGKVFRIDEAMSGENFMPLHPNCDCSVEVLDKNNNVVFPTEEEKPETEKDTDTMNYLQVSLRQIVLGNYTDEVNLVGTLGQIALGFAGLDLPGDVRDILYDITNFEMTPGHILQTLLDILAVVPVVGAVKYVDEGFDLTKSAIKYGDEAAEIVKEIKNTTDFSDFPKKIHVGKQGKHIVGHNNYIEGKSLLDVSVNEAQKLINKYSGKGQKIGRNKERVDFGRIIGKYVDPKTGQSYNTTTGTIHYSNSGTHIVPDKPIDWRE